MLKDKKLVWTIIILLLAAIPLSACAPQATPTPAAPAPVKEVTRLVEVTRVAPAPERKLKAGFIYVGPIGDYGWSHAHNEGRLYVENKFPWLETIYAEAVPEADVERFLDRFIVEEKCDVVFTTSFGFMDGTIAAANKYPDKIFFHCSGFKRAPNAGTYMADFYQIYYLNGLMAGALTKTGKVGYVAAHPIPEVVRHINAFTLGVREVNPKATVDVRWLFSWYDPAKAREAAEALIAAGCDTLAFTEDSPTVLQVGQEYTQKGQQIYTFSHYSPMEKFGPDSCVSGQLVDWGILYEDMLTKVYLGIYTNKNLENVDYWWLLREGAVKLGGSFEHPINPKFADALKAVKVTDPLLGQLNVYDLVMKRMEQMKDPAMLFDPFTGPIKDQNGVERVKAGQRLSIGELLSIDWFVEGNIGTIPR
ncbi:MAG: BMP family ABC transporter substrate-binding protein [Chloroflexi bacterium]|nr:BMP family ABC transporter substrate-binding protein [Chloroflexota bacterium]